MGNSIGNREVGTSMSEKNDDAVSDSKEQEHEHEEPEQQPEPADPVKKWTRRTIVVAAVLLALYLVADRLTPYSSQARVHALVVPVASEVSGTVVEVAVEDNQFVDAGELLFRIDDGRYKLAVANAEASLQSARQATGASSATVDAASAGVRSAEANLARAAQDVERLRRIKSQDPGAISDRRIETAEASFIVAQQQLAAAEANLDKARQSLGSAGDENSRVQQAQAALDAALLDLERTAIVAPDRGLVTDVRVDRGNFSGAGVPQLTFISTSDVWVRADLTENNLGHVDPGDEVGLVFDIYPGRVFKGTVRTVGYGVAVDSAPLGALPTINNDRQWLRDAQRFPVAVDFEMEREDMMRLRVGAQASVVVYTTDSFLLNSIGRLYLRVVSLLSYAY